MAYNLGSIATNIIVRNPDITTAVSGQMISIIDEWRMAIENQTGLTVGSPTIQERFIPSLLALGTASALRASAGGLGAASLIDLGDFRVDLRNDGMLLANADRYEAEGKEKLRKLGVRIDSSRVIGAP